MEKGKSCLSITKDLAAVAGSESPNLLTMHTLFYFWYFLLADRPQATIQNTNNSLFRYFQHRSR